MGSLVIYLRRGLFALALAFAISACGDDDDGTISDAGVDGGPDGAVTAGRGGSGGPDAGDAGPTMAQCVDQTADNTQGMATQECIQCVCENDPVATLGCNEICWGLVACYAQNCSDVDVDDVNASVACAVDKCPDFKSKIIEAQRIGPTIDGPCVDECVMLPPDTTDDAGVDAGL